MNGITEFSDEKYHIFYIDSLTDDIKGKIRSSLSEICNSPWKAKSGHISYSYKNTLKNFLILYDTKDGKKNNTNRQKGLIGELLVHLLFLEYYPKYIVNSAFFNTEEHSFKKGFDAILTNKENKELWITEVKAGENKKGKNATQTIQSLLSTSKLDLKKRLADNSEYLWQNAVNHATIYMEKAKRNEKKAVLDLLEDYHDKATINKITSNEINVFLAGVLFHNMIEKFDKSVVPKKLEAYEKKKEFNKIQLIAIQQKAYMEIKQFLESEIQ